MSMETCIICDNPNQAKSVEHIVPESFGNKDYVMEKNNICDSCNSRFAKFEGKALTNTVFVMERARFGIETKKGKNVKGKIGELTIKGDEKFRKDLVTVKGLNKENFKKFDPSTRIGELIVKGFDKSEVATSRMLLKIGIEALFTSRRKIFEKYDFTELKGYLTNKTNEDWGFITASKEHGKFISIPRFYKKYKLNGINCKLRVFERSRNELLFKFQYGGISMIINLLNRKLDWVWEYKNQEEHVHIYPLHIDERWKKANNS